MTSLKRLMTPAKMYLGNILVIVTMTCLLRPFRYRKLLRVKCTHVVVYMLTVDLKRPTPSTVSLQTSVDYPTYCRPFKALYPRPCR
jgi:hypothetical protein